MWRCDNRLMYSSGLTVVNALSSAILSSLLKPGSATHGMMTVTRSVGLRELLIPVGDTVVKRSSYLWYVL